MTATPIPSVSAAALLDATHPGHGQAVAAARIGAAEIGFLTVHDTPLTAARVMQVIAAYRAFFALPAARKALLNPSASPMHTAKW